LKIKFKPTGLTKFLLRFDRFIMKPLLVYRYERKSSSHRLIENNLQDLFENPDALDAEEKKEILLAAAVIENEGDDMSNSSRAVL